MKRTCQEFWLKNKSKTRNYLFKEINRNKLMSNEISKKHRKICKTVSYIEHFLILASTITGCISSSAFTSLISLPRETTNSAIRLKICIKKHR